MKLISRPASLRGNPYLNLRVISRPIMKFDPNYLSEEASLGVLLVDGFCMGVIEGYYTLVKEIKA